MKDEPKYWVVVVNLNHEAKTYIVGRVVRSTEGGLFKHFVQVEAEDEIGAFNEATKVLARLDFKPGA